MKNKIIIPFIAVIVIFSIYTNIIIKDYESRINDIQIELNEMSEIETNIESKIEENKIVLPNRGSGRTFEVEASAYTHTDEGCNRITYSENKVREGHTIAVNPSQIPIGSIVYIQNENIEGYYVAEDIGGAISHGYIDIYMENREDALIFGRQQVQVEIIRHGWSG